jgi:predicted nucleotidyltransferase
MSVELAELAESLAVNERTLRRAWTQGTVRGERVTPYKLSIPAEERAYLRRHWSTIAHLRGLLRTEPNVSLAVVFGSVARGDDQAGSDVDVLVDLRHSGLRNRVALTERLRRRTVLPLEVVTLEDAMRRPALIAEIVRDGRVLVDRDGQWRGMQARADRLDARAREDREVLAERAREAVEMFARRADVRA